MQSIINSSSPTNWLEILERDFHDFCFLSVLTPTYDQIFSSLNSTLEKLQNIKRLLSKTSLQHIIVQQTASIFFDMCFRPLLFELQEAKKNGFLTAETPSLRYQQFVQLMQEPDNYAAFFEKYSVLKQKLDIFLKHYLASSKEFFQNLEQDLPELVAKGFLPISDNLKLTNVISTGDRHLKGRTVNICEFSSSDGTHKLVYKPRNLDIDLAYNQLIDWVSKSGNIQLSTIDTLSHHQHGWCEFIETRTNQTEQQAKDYYVRLGALLAICYLLNATDMHLENLLPCADMPYLVDLECLLSPCMRFPSPEAFQHSLHTVKHTMILPMSLFTEDAEAEVDYSGFAGAANVQKSVHERLVVINTHTDIMDVKRERPEVDLTEKQPTLQGKLINPTDYSDEFIEGFTATYQLIHQNKEQLQQLGLIENFKNKRVRVLVRSTGDYASLLKESFHPALLTDVKNYDEHLNWLTKEPFKQEFVDKAQQHTAELASIKELDIPAFFHNTSGEHVIGPNGEQLSSFIFKPSYQFLQHKLAQLSDRDLTAQLNIIKQSFAIYNYNQAEKGKPRTNNNVDQNAHKPEHDITQLENIIDSLFEYLFAQSVESEGGLYWPTIGSGLSKIFMVVTESFDLYTGMPGILLSCVESLLKFPTLTKLTQHAAQLQQQLIKHIDASVDGVGDVGFYNGLSGVLYTILRLKALDASNDFAAQQKKLLHLLEQSIEQNQSVDTIKGLSGYLLMLCNSHQHLPEQTAIKHAKLCAQRILKLYPDPANMPETQTWGDFKEKTILGVAHGCTGVLLALAKYHLWLNDPQAKQWVERALAFERSSYNPEQQAWPNAVRNSDGSQENAEYLSNWCYGSNGIGLSRLELRRSGWQDPMFDKEIEAALQHNAKLGFSGVLNFCHGDFAALELNLLAEQAGFLSQGSTKQQFDQQVLPQLAYTFDALKTEHVGSSINIPGLMTGLAGVVYALLRFNYPDEIASLVLLQSC